METQNNNSININTTNHSQIKKSINIKSIAIASVLLAVGAVCFFLFSKHPDSKSTLSMVYISLGATLIVCSLILFFTKFQQKVYVETGSVIKNKSYPFNRAQLGEMKDSLAGSKFNQAEPLKVMDNGNCRMDILRSADNKFVAVQLFEYIPFVYEAATPVYYFSEKQADDFVSYLEKCK